MNMPQWLMRIEQLMDAHFIQADGSSRPGTDWIVGLKYGDQEFKALVRSYLSPDISPEARANREYQGQTVMGYLHDQLAQGWRPEQDKTHVITIQNPTTPLPSMKKKAWWRWW